MFSKKNLTAQMDAPNTIIGGGAVLEAVRLTGNDSVRIDGIYRGNIDIEGSLVLGDTGSVTGDISAKYIVIAGRVNGNIRCESMLHFASTARVTGDIETQALIVDEGSQISGQYYVGEFPSVNDPSSEASGEKIYTDDSYEIIDK